MSESGSTTEHRLELDLRAPERRLYDRVRRRITGRAGATQATAADDPAHSSARDLLLLLPDLVVLLGRLVRDPRVPFGCKVIALAGIAYALSPLDLIPDILGPLGLFDDVLVVSAALSHILNNVHPDLVRSHWSGSGDALRALQRVAAWAESLLGNTLTRILGFRRA